MTENEHSINNTDYTSKSKAGYKALQMESRREKTI